MACSSCVQEPQNCTSPKKGRTSSQQQRKQQEQQLALVYDLSASKKKGFHLSGLQKKRKLGRNFFSRSCW